MTGNKIPLEIIRFFRWKITKERILPRNMPEIPLFVIGLLQLAITWYKKGHYYSRTGTLRQRDLNQWSLTCLCFDVPVSAGIIMSLPSSNGDFVPPDC